MMMRLTTIGVLLAGCVAFAAGLTFAKPDGWQKVATTSSMRTAQFALPRAEGDGEDGELVVYYFGGGGGSVDANIERWVGQIEQPGGASSAGAAKKETRQINGLTVSLVDVSGTYTAEMAPGSAARHNKPGYRLRAAVIVTPQGPYFIKLTGPQKTIARWDKEFERFVASLRYE
jgi:hypothetical protein